MIERPSARVYDIIAGKILENIRDLGEIILRPKDFAKVTIENRLGRASCTIGWTRLLYDKQIVESDLIPKMADLISYLHDIVKDQKYEDGEILIKSTLLYRMAKPATYFSKFPDDAISTLESFIREEIK